MHLATPRILSCACLAWFGSIGSASATSATVEQRSVHEVALEATGSYADPYLELTAEVKLSPPDSHEPTVRLPMFWDGGSTWKFRFSPEQTGEWTWAISSHDAGLNGRSGKFNVVASGRQGGIRPRRGAPHHFERQDGSRFWFMGDTAWAMFTDSAEQKHDRAGVETYLRRRADQGINVVHAMLLSEAGWGNVGGEPWHDLARERLNPEYWREVDERVAFANDLGVVVGLALAWGEKTGRERYPWGRFPSVEARHRYARYVAARYGAYDVYFIVSGEWHGEVRNRRSTEEVLKSEFIAIGDTLREADPHGRMIGIHPMTRHGSVREYNDAGWMSFGDYQQNYERLHQRILESRRFDKPVVNSEYAYFLRDQSGDGTIDKQHSFSAADIRNATWDIVMAGGYVVTGFGSTYMGGNRHPTPFRPDDPANEPWERQIAHIKALFTSLDYEKLVPSDELLTCPQPRSPDRFRRVQVRGMERKIDRAPATAYWCLAEPGRHYLLYVRGLNQPVTMELEGNEPLVARRFDPRTGEFLDLGSVGEGRYQFQPPDEQDWLVMLAPGARAAGPNRPNDPLPEGVRVIRDLRYVADGHERHTMDLYLPRASADVPLVVWVHGGGWRSGDKNSPRALRPLLEAGFAVAGINYRLSQHAIFPAQLEDCKAAVRWLRARATDYGYDPERIGAFGVSAGGHLVSLLGTTGHVRDFDVGNDLDQSSQVQAVCSWFGPTDFSLMDRQSGPAGKFKHDAAGSPESALIGGAVPDHPERVRRANPITYIKPGAPPFLLMHGDLDMLVPLGQSEVFAEALRKAEIPVELIVVEGAGHGFRGAANLQEKSVVAFFQKTLGPAPRRQDR